MTQKRNLALWQGALTLHRAGWPPGLHCRVHLPKNTPKRNSARTSGIADTCKGEAGRHLQRKVCKARIPLRARAGAAPAAGCEALSKQSPSTNTLTQPAGRTRARLRLRLRLHVGNRAPQSELTFLQSRFPEPRNSFHCFSFHTRSVFQTIHLWQKASCLALARRSACFAT